MKNHVIMFCENESPESKDIEKYAKIFCIPFYKIQEAMEFCELEEIYSAYIGFRRNHWVIDSDKDDMTPAIRITRNGIHDSNKKKYIWVMKKINVPQDLYTRLQPPSATLPSS